MKLLDAITRAFGRDSCTRDCRAHLSPYVDGELDAQERERVESHLSNCARCRREYDEILFASRAAALIVPPVAPPSTLPVWLKQDQPKTAARLIDVWRGSRLFPLGAAAVVLLLLVGAALFYRVKRPQERTTWEVTRLTGAPTVNYRRVEKTSGLVVGDWIETDFNSRALIKVGFIGHVELESGSRVRLSAARPEEHRLELVRGRMHAEIYAPPRIFFTETPSATAIDYGCSYTLEVDDRGASLLRVTGGWVSLAAGGREAMVPAGAACRAEPGRGPGTPYLSDAPAALRDALNKFDFRDGGDGALDIVLNAARAKDSLTLWHLLARTDGAARARVYEKLAALVPPPNSVTREGALRLDRRMLDEWRERIDYASVGVDPASVPVSTGSIVPAGTTNVARFAHTATLLSDGRVLLAGGLERHGIPLASAELYEHNKATFTRIPDLTTPRVGHTATLLADGTVLVTGGSDRSFFEGALKSAELYDPSASKFVAVSSMNAPRLAHRATVLPDGKVLITGGQDDTGRKLDTAEIYDPATKTFTPVKGRMVVSRSDHTATLLRSGQVLITGGATAKYPGEVPVSTAELYDPSQEAFRPTGSLSAVRYKHSATLLPDGRVIVVGGSDARMWGGTYATAEIYDPPQGVFKPTGNMSTARYKIRDAVVLLPNGKLLVAGGGARAEVYDPTTGIFALVKGGSGVSRYYSTATLLRSGEVLIVGGYLGLDSRVLDNVMHADMSAWIYRP